MTDDLIIHSNETVTATNKQKMEKDDSKVENIDTVLKDLLDNTTIHGLAKISSSKRIAVKIFWVIVFIAAVVLFAIQLDRLIKVRSTTFHLVNTEISISFVAAPLVEILREYNSNPKQTTVTLQSGTVKFPAVTLCNMNTVKLSSVNLQEQLAELVNADYNVRLMGGSSLYSFNPQDMDVYEYILAGHTVESFESENAPILYSYWEMIFYLRSLYLEKHPKPPESEWDTTLLTRNDIRMLLGEPTQAASTLATTDSLPSNTLSIHSNTSQRAFSPSNKSHHTTSQTTQDNTTQRSTVQPTDSAASHRSPTSTTPLIERDTTQRSRIQTTPPTESRTPQRLTSPTNSSTDTTSNVRSTSEPERQNNSNVSTTDTPFTGDQTSSTRDPGISSPEVIVTISQDHSRRYLDFKKYFRGILDRREYQQPMTMWKTRTALFEAILRQQKRDFRFHLGHQFEDLMISSFFARKQENITSYKRHWTEDYGNCYTIDSPKYEARKGGPRHGFDFLLNLEMDEYIFNIQESQGIRIVLHEQGTEPFPSAEGITLAPGYEHQIGLKMVQTSILGSPYGVCTDGQQFFEKFKTKYTRTTCTEICKIELYVNECGCMPQDSTEILDKYVDLPVCEFSMNSSVKACTQRMLLKLRSDIDMCDCVEPCRTTTYLKTVSGRPWPTNNYMRPLFWKARDALKPGDTLIQVTNVIIDSLCQGSILPSMIQICYEHRKRDINVQRYRNNFMKIQIYFEDTQYQVVAEESTYGVVRFLSDIGGIAGLFIGASVMSFFEIVQFVLELMIHVRRRWLLPRTPGVYDG